MPTSGISFQITYRLIAVQLKSPDVSRARCGMLVIMRLRAYVPRDCKLVSYPPAAKDPT